MKAPSPKPPTNAWELWREKLRRQDRPREESAETSPIKKSRRSQHPRADRAGMDWRMPWGAIRGQPLGTLLLVPAAASRATSSVRSLSRVRLFATPWTAALQASLSITNSRSLPKLMSIESVTPSNHLILCRPLLLLPSMFPSIRVFSNELVLRIRWLRSTSNPQGPKPLQQLQPTVPAGPSQIPWTLRASPPSLCLPD